MLLQAEGDINQEHDIIFEEFGHVVGKLSYAHMHIPIPLDMAYKLKNQITTFMKVLIMKTEGLYSNNKELAMETNKTVSLAVGNLDDRVGLLESIYSGTRYTQTGGTIHREKRQLAFIAGLFAGTIFGLFSAPQMSQLQEQVGTLKEVQKHVLETVKNHEIRIRTNEENIVTIESHVNSLERWVTNQQHADSIREIKEACLRAISDAANIIDRLEVGLASLMYHRLHPTILDTTSLNGILFRLRKSAADKGYDIFLKKAADIFQMETSYHSVNSTLHIFVHCPMSHNTDAMRALRHVPFPIKLDSTHGIYISDTVNNVIAIHPDRDGTFLTMPASALNGCPKLGDTYMCEQAFEIHNDLHRHCIGALYSQNLTAVTNLCRHSISPLADMVHRLSSNRFLLFRQEPDHALLKCTTGVRKDINIQSGISQIQVPDDCELKMKYSSITAVSTLIVDIPVIHLQPRWDLQIFAHLGGLSETKTSYMAMKKAGVKPTNIEEIETWQKQNAAIKLFTPHSTTTIVAVIISISLLLIGYKLYICCFSSQTQKNPPSYSATDTVPTALPAERGLWRLIM